MNETGLKYKELKALYDIANIDCTGVSCLDCPFKVLDNKVCFSSLAGEIFLKMSIKEGDSND